MSNKASKKKTLSKVLKYTSRYSALLILSILLAAAIVALTLYVPVLIGNAIDLIAGKGRVDFGGVLAYLQKIGIIVALTALMQWIMNSINNHITYNVIRDVRRDAFIKLEDLPLGYIDSHPHGETVSRITSDVEQFADGLLMGFTQLFTGVLTILGTLVFMIRLNGKIALLVAALTPLSLLSASFIAKRTYNMFTLRSQAQGKQTSFINEIITNQKVVSAFSREEETIGEFSALNDRLKGLSLKAIFYSSLTNPTTRFINSLVYASVGIFGALAVLGGHGLTVGALSCFLSYANQYTKPFNEISGVVTELQNALACAARIFELIEAPPQKAEQKNLLPADIKGNIELENVCFSYTKEKKLIENISLSVKSGQRIAIVGPTGCGKTTLINLFMRFYDVTGGKILIDGADIQSVTRKSLRQSFGMVLQDTWLKHATVKENIALGKPGATDEEIIAAAKASHAHSFITRLPQGYDTELSEDGGSLSQGQKQLISISRVMLQKPPMLILDEATSSIDTRTELKIQNAFNRLMEGKTSFIVAHRLSTIREADLILVMKDGNIIEHGTHESLLEKNGFYAVLYNSQFANNA